MSSPGGAVVFNSSPQSPNHHAIGNPRFPITPGWVIGEAARWPGNSGIEVCPSCTLKFLWQYLSPREERIKKSVLLNAVRPFCHLFHSYSFYIEKIFQLFDFISLEALDICTIYIPVIQNSSKCLFMFYKIKL